DSGGSGCFGPPAVPATTRPRHRRRGRDVAPRRPEGHRPARPAGPRRHPGRRTGGPLRPGRAGAARAHRREPPGGAAPRRAGGPGAAAAGAALWGGGGARPPPGPPPRPRHYVKEMGLTLRRFVHSNPEAYVFLRGRRERIKNVRALAALYDLQGP